MASFSYASAPPQDKAAMAQGQVDPPPYQEVPAAGYPPQPGPEQPLYGASGYPYTTGQPGQQQYPGQPYPGQQYPGQQQYLGQQQNSGVLYPGAPGLVAIQPKAYVTRVPLEHPVKDYLGYSIFTLLCCCMPLGVAALIYSIFTREANLNGDQAGAKRNSRTALTLNHVGLGLGILTLILTVILMVVMVGL